MGKGCYKILGDSVYGQSVPVNYLMNTMDSMNLATWTKIKREYSPDSKAKFLHQLVSEM